MDLEDLVNAVMRGDLITAREWIADARRSNLQWEQIGRPERLNDRGLVVAAGLAELLAEREGTIAASWTEVIGGASEPLLLDPGLNEMPRSMQRAMTDAPESLRKRNLIALPDFLRIA
jgi:hypothetical protein